MSTAKIIHGPGYGSVLAAEVAADLAALKAKAALLAAVLQSATADGASTTNIAAGGSNAALFNVPAGQGGNFYNIFNQASVGLCVMVAAIPDDKIAAVYQG